jgi:hypothetical protein
MRDLEPVGKNLTEFSDTVKSQPWRLIYPSTKKYPKNPHSERSDHHRSQERKAEIDSERRRTLIATRSFSRGAIPKTSAPLFRLERSIDIFLFVRVFGQLFQALDRFLIEIIFEDRGMNVAFPANRRRVGENL